MRIKSYSRFFITIIVVLILVGGSIAGGISLANRWLGGTDSNLGSLVGSIRSKQKTQPKNEAKGPAYLNLLLLGVDEDGYRTDVIILTQYNAVTKQVNMLQIPRDTHIKTNRSDKKINSAYAFGKEKELFTAVKNLTGVEVNKFILVNTKGFRTLVDEIGGVEVDVPIKMNYDDPVQGLHIKLDKGKQVLNGKKAEMFIRFRKNNDHTGYPEGDIGRVKAQQKFIQAMISKSLSIKNIFKIPKLVSIIMQNVKTNFEINEITRYVTDALKLNRENVNMQILPGESKITEGVWYYMPDNLKTKDIITQYFTPGNASPNNAEPNGQTATPLREKTNSSTQEMTQDGNAVYKTTWTNRFVKVEVLNGCGNEEYTNQVAEDLKQKGFNVIRTGNVVGIEYIRTKVIDRNNKNYSKEVGKALGSSDITKDLDKTYDVDVTVIVGKEN